VPGFSGVIGQTQDIFGPGDPTAQRSRTTENRRHSLRDIRLKHFVVPKFPNDKVFAEDDDCFVCTDGVLLNSTQLRSRYSVNTNFELIKAMYTAQGLSFPTELRGAFAGCFYHKTTDSFHLFTDHLGAKPLFYYFDSATKVLIFGSELTSVTRLMTHFGIKPRLSDVGAYCLLTFGFMLESHTLVDAVKRLSPGSVLTYQNGTVATKQYYRLDNTHYHKETATAITSNLTELFAQAVNAEYEKDKEYGYDHIGTLSGGLDSRMNLLSAWTAGYKDIYTITVSQSNYLDERIAKNIAGQCGFHFLFYSLDNGNYLRDIEGPAVANDGLVLYSGAAHLYKMLSLLNWRQFGLLHTGMLGDVVLGGTYLSRGDHVKAQPFDGTYSRELSSRISSVATALAKEYDNAELFLWYNRGINGVLNGYWMANQFTECASPFLQVDFLNYAMNIHPGLRLNYRIYHQWIAKYLPEAAKFTWELTGRKVSAKYLFWYRVRRVREVASRVMWGPGPGSSMNPFEYWFKANGQLLQWLNGYFVKHIDALKDRPELRKDTARLFEKGTPLEKTQALTLLAAVQLLGVNS